MKLNNQASISDLQVDLAEKFVRKYMSENRERLRTIGVPYSEIYDTYKVTTNFPITHRGFPRVLKNLGLGRIQIRGVCTYIIIESI
jgi:hypothetical protein